MKYNSRRPGLQPDGKQRVKSENRICLKLSISLDAG